MKSVPKISQFDRVDKKNSFCVTCKLVLFLVIRFVKRENFKLDKISYKVM